MVSKFIAFLDSDVNFYSLGKREDRYYWEDKETPLVRLIAPISNPFNTEWQWLISLAQNKSDSVTYPARVDFKLFPITQNQIRCEVIRDVYKGKFLDSQYTSLRHLGFSHKGQSNLWISYMVMAL